MLRAIILVGCLLLFFACSAPQKIENSEDPAGLYINKTLMDTLDEHTLLGGIPRLCEEILFMGNDSLELNNIVERTRVHFSLSGNGNYFIDDSTMIKFPFTVKNETIDLWDTGFLQTKTPSVFIKSDKGFVELLNDKIISGTYILNTPHKTDTILFDGKGNIYHWKNWKNYELCLAGDCASMAEEPANIINLLNDQSDDFFTWKCYQNPVRIVFYSLAEETPDIKGDRKNLNDSIVLFKVQ